VEKTMRRLILLVVLCWACALPAVTAAADGNDSAKSEIIRIANDKLQIGLDGTDGTLRELTQLPDGSPQLSASSEPFALWQITLHSGDASQELSADQAGEAAVSTPGIGLGLALSRRLARAMGGDLRLDAAVTEGACFILTLPKA
jgi:hypothetical protein